LQFLKDNDEQTAQNTLHYRTDRAKGRKKNHLEQVLPKAPINSNFLENKPLAKAGKSPHPLTIWSLISGRGGRKVCHSLNPQRKEVLLAAMEKPRKVSFRVT
jgi:hypothetical protein